MPPGALATGTSSARYMMLHPRPLMKYLVSGNEYNIPGLIIAGIQSFL